MNTIGARIKQRRMLLGLTQKQIYSMTNISSGNLSEYENGMKFPSSKAIIELAKALQCSTDWILLGDEPDNPTLKAEESEFIKSYRSLSPLDQNRLLHYMNYMIYEEQQELESTATAVEENNHRV